MNGHLCHVRWDVGGLINHARSDLSNVHIDHQAVVPINFKELVFVQGLGLDEALDVDIFMRQDDVCVSVLVTWGSHVVDSKVLVDFLFIIFEKIVALGGDLIVGISSKILSHLLRDLSFETSKGNFFLDEFVD